MELPDNENVTGGENNPTWEGLEPECRLELPNEKVEKILFGRAAQNLSVGWRLWQWLMRLDNWEVGLCAEVVVEALWYIRSAKGFFRGIDLTNYFFLLENAHASINLHSVQKAKHILKNSCEELATN